MQGLTQEEERFKVLLMGIEEDTEERRETFCRDVSKKYNLSFALLHDVIERCPIVLRKNIPLKKAEALARALKQFGALVSVEASRHSPPIRLEFQDLASPALALEDSRFRRKQDGMWSVTGKVKNISDARLSDLWVLVQFFGPDGDLITFEEVPLPINPLPPRLSSPFKLLFEGSPMVASISIAFKSAEGTPLCASDARQAVGQTPEQPTQGDLTPVIPDSPEDGPAEGTASEGSSQDFQSAAPSSPPDDLQGPGQEAEADKPAEAIPRVQDTVVGESAISEESHDSSLPAEAVSGLERQDLEMIGVVFPELTLSSPILRPTEEEASAGPSPLEEASQILGEISSGDRGSDPQEETGATMKAPSERSGKEISPTEGKDLTVIPWIEPFRKSVDAFHGQHHDPFQQWFRNCQTERIFESEFHALGTILLHSRFDQMTPSAKALENTERTYSLVMRPSLELEDIPTLEGTSRFPGDQWRTLLHKAVPRLREVTQLVLARPCWSVTELERLLQVIPHMGRQTSRRATQWIRALMAGIVQVDLSQAQILIGIPLYRVAARLGLVDLRSDGHEGSNWTADVRIQSFAKTAFPEDILKIEAPMEWVGSSPEEKGHCAPIRPQCEECLFEGFCPKLHVHADPCETGMPKAH